MSVEAEHWYIGMEVWAVGPRARVQARASEVLFVLPAGRLSTSRINPQVL